MNIFVRGVSGTTIEGKVYFKGGAPAQEVDVVASDPAGERIGETRTDAEGLFSLEAKYRCDHALVARTADGHESRKPAVVKAAQLPAELPFRGDSMPVLTPNAPAAEATPPPAAIDALRAQLDEVREQLDRMENTTRLRDILGGIGYIVGLSGIAFYLLARRAPKSQ